MELGHTSSGQRTRGRTALVRGSVLVTPSLQSLLGTGSYVVTHHMGANTSREAWQERPRRQVVTPPQPRPLGRLGKSPPSSCSSRSRLNTQCGCGSPARGGGWARGQRRPQSCSSRPGGLAGRRAEPPVGPGKDPGSRPAQGRQRGGRAAGGHGWGAGLVLGDGSHPGSPGLCPPLRNSPPGGQQPAVQPDPALLTPGPLPSLLGNTLWGLGVPQGLLLRAAPPDQAQLLRQAQARKRGHQGLAAYRGTGSGRCAPPGCAPVEALGGCPPSGRVHARPPSQPRPRPPSPGSSTCR